MGGVWFGLTWRATFAVCRLFSEMLFMFISRFNIGWVKQYIYVYFSSVEVHTITVLWMDQVGSEHLGLFCFWRWCKSWNSCSMDQYYQYQALPWRRHVSHPLKLFSWSSVICVKFSTDNIFRFSFVRLGHPWFSLIFLCKRAFCSTKRMHLKHSTNRFCGETWCIAVFIK